MTNSTNIASLDIGFFNLKGGKTTATTVEQLRSRVVNSEESDVDLDLFLLPAGACPVRDLPHSFGKDIGGETVLVNGELWQGGVAYSLTPNIDKDYSDSYKHTPEWKALLYTGLKRLGYNSIDCLVMGLPCEEFYTKPQAVQDVIDLAKGKHKIDNDTYVEVNHVIVMPQPLGSFHGYYLAEEDERIRKILKKSITVVADPGYGTFDYVVINRGEHVLHHSAGSTRKSVRAVCLETERLLQKKHPNLTLAPHDIENCIVEKDWEILVDKELVNIQETFKTAANTIGKAAFKHLRTSLSTHNVKPQMCILTAGGAPIFEEIALQESGADELLTSEFSIYLNVFGYLYEAINQKIQSNW